MNDLPHSTLRTPPRFMTLVAMAAASPLTLNMVLPALPRIAAELDASYAMASLAVSGYLAMTVAVQLIVGPLSDRVGRRPMMLAVLAIFTLASVGCALATNIWMLLIFRMAQSVMVSGFAIALAVVRDVHGDQGAAKRIAKIAMTMAVIPMIGPTVGGLIETAFGWRAIFLFYALIGAGLLAVTWADLGETRRETTRAPAFVLLKRPAFLAPSICVSFAISAFFAFAAIAPLAAETAYGFTTAQVGMVIGSITLGFMAGSWLTSRLDDRFSLRTVMLAGRVSAMTGIVISGLVLVSGIASPLAFFAPILLVGFGNGLTNPTANALALAAAPGQAGSAAGLSGAMTVAAGAVITALAGALVPPDQAQAGLLLVMAVAVGISLAAGWMTREGR